MKPSPANSQQNEILFIGRTKILTNQNGRIECLKLDRTLVIDLNGGMLYRSTESASALNNSLSRQGKQNSSTLQQFQTPLASFPILPQTKVYQTSTEDSSIDQYLKQLGTTRDKNQYLCWFSNTKQSVMFPMFFESKSTAIKFHVAVLIYQMHNRHYPSLEKMRLQKGLQNIKINLKLMQTLAKGIVNQDIVIDPHVLSTVDMQELELGIIRDAIDRLCRKSSLRNSSKQQTNAINQSQSQLMNSSSATAFSLRLRYYIVDQISLSYLPQLVSDQILHNNVRQFDIAGCGVNDRVLHIMFKDNASRRPPQLLSTKLNFGNNYINLVRINLSNNELTDLCFIALRELVQNTPCLSDLCLNKNRIKLEMNPSFKKQQKQLIRMSKVSPSPQSSPRGRISAMRMSTQFNPMSLSKSSNPLFIQFLQSLPHTLNYLSIDSNLICETDLLVSYIIEAEDVPVRYLSLRNNKISELDKIRMAKLIISELRERTDDFFVTIDFGQISVVDSEVQQYIMLAKQKHTELDIDSVDNKNNSLVEPSESRRSTRQISTLSLSDLKKFENTMPNSVKVAITLNKEWQLCDQEGMLEVNNLYKNRRKSTINRKSQVINSVLLGNITLSPSNSEQSLKRDSNTNSKISEHDRVTHDNMRHFVSLLKEAYQNHSYAGIGLYKQMLQEYNPELFTLKIAPLFTIQEKELAREKSRIIDQLNQFINMVFKNSHAHTQKYNDKLDALIVKLFLRRIENEVGEGLVLKWEEDEIEELPRKFTWNVFTYLLYLRDRRDRIIEKLIAQKYDPFCAIVKLKYQEDLYNEYYVAYRSWLCSDNYKELVLKNIEPVIIDTDQPITQKQQGTPSETMSQSELHNMLKQDYIRKHRGATQYERPITIHEDEQFLCAVEPKLAMSGYLVQYYTANGYIKSQPAQKANKKAKNVISYGSILSRLKCQLASCAPVRGSPITTGINNHLDFISRHDILNPMTPCLCINPNMKSSQLASCETLKLAVYNPAFETNLQQFSGIVVAFLKFLHHSPQSVQPGALQYLNYIVDIVLQEQDSYNVECMGTEFYLQLITYNVHSNPEVRASQINPNILLTLVEYCSMYLPYNQMAQNFIFAHLMRAESKVNAAIGVSKQSGCCVIREQYHSESHHVERFSRKEDQLPADVVTHLFTNNINPKADCTNILHITLRVLYPDKNSGAQEGLLDGHSTIEINMHILTRIQQVYEHIGASQVCKQWRETGSLGEQVKGNANFGLFSYNLDSHKCSLLLPSTSKIVTLYSLLQQYLITPHSQPLKNIIIAKPLIADPMLIHSSHSDAQLHWWYSRVYAGFREHGGCLPMITACIEHIEGSGQVVDIIVECMLCDVLIKQKEQIMHVIDEGHHEEYISSICEIYGDNLQSYCPKDTAATLSGPQKMYIKAELKKCLQEQLSKLLKTNTSQSISKSELEKAQSQMYSYAFRSFLHSFYKHCQLLTSPTELSSSTANMQILVTVYGLVLIRKVIYVQALLWRYVYDIRVLHSTQSNSSKVVKQVQMHYCTPKGDKKVLVVGFNAGAAQQIFANAFLLLLKNLAIMNVMSHSEKLYRMWSSFQSSYQGVLKQESRPVDVGVDKGKLKTFWQELIDNIDYIAVEPKSAIGLESLNQDMPNEQTARKSQTSFFPPPKPPSSERPSTPSMSQSRQLAGLTNHNPKKQNMKQSEELVQKKARDIDSHDIGFSNIVQKVQSPDPIKEEDSEQIIVTNSRRSSRRELPKRRSSREK